MVAVSQVLTTHLLQIPYKVVARREGDVAACYANPSLAREELGWTAALGLDRMCKCWPSPLAEGLGRGYPGGGTPHRSVADTPLGPLKGEDLWRWQKLNPSGFGAQA